MMSTGAWSLTNWSSAAPFIAVTSAGNNESLFMGVLAETTSVGGPGAYAVQVGGPVTLSVVSQSVAVGQRLFATDTAGVYATTASAVVQASAGTNVVNMFAVPMIVAAQSRTTSAAAQTIAAFIIPPHLARYVVEA